MNDAGSSAVPAHGTNLRSMAFSVYLPTFLFAAGQGAVIPVVALTALSLGASAAGAGLIVALTGVGILLFDLPSGWLISRFGEGASIAIGTVILLAALIGSATAHSVVALGIATVFMGCGWSVWMLARMSYVADVVPIAFRGRALSTLGGIQRVGNFVGPFVGAGLIALTGLRSAYYLHFVLAAAASIVMILALRAVTETAGASEPTPATLLGTVKSNSHTFLTAGVATAMISGVRSIRQALIPLWALHIGLGPEAASIVFGTSLGMEVLLFYPAGVMMDRLGRKPTTLTCLALVSAGLFILPLAHNLATFLAVAILIGVGNGVGSGIIMTIGVDFSPAVGRAQFLSAWRLCGDVGTASGPLAAAGIIGVATLGVAAVATGFMGVLAGLVVLAVVPETLHRRPPAGRAFEQDFRSLDAEI